VTASKKKSESSSSSSAKAEKAPSTPVESAAPKVAGVSDALRGPTTADLNPAYNAAAQDEAAEEK
jgi:hypothetical protein